jgi:hypothetical protein
LIKELIMNDIIRSDLAATDGLASPALRGGEASRVPTTPTEERKAGSNRPH